MNQLRNDVRTPQARRCNKNLVGQGGRAAALMLLCGTLWACDSGAGYVHPLQLRDVGEQDPEVAPTCPDDVRANFIARLRAGAAAAPPAARLASSAPQAGLPEALSRAYQVVTGPSDICIVMHAGANQDSFVDIASANHEAYARRHGYNYFRYRGHLDGDGDGFLDPENTYDRRRDGVYWQSLVATGWVLQARAANSGAPLCRWVFTVDGDVLMTTPSVDLHRALSEGDGSATSLLEEPGVDVILAREQLGVDRILINAGVFAVRNSPGGLAFVAGVLQSFPEYKDRSYHEQDAMQDYAFSTDYAAEGRGDWETNRRTLRPEIAVVRQRAINSFHRFDAVPSNVDTIWQPGDFIAHLTATSAEDRVERMRRLLAQTSHL